MQASAPTGPMRPIGALALVILIFVALLAVVLVLAAYAWYPTTLQPDVTLRDLRFNATACAPVLGGYANRYNATFTLAISGRADGNAAVQYLLGNFSLGFQHYLVPQGKQVNGTAAILWEVVPTPSGCGPLDVPGPPAVYLASVTRSPQIDERLVIQTVAGPASALGFMALLLGVLGLLARRHGVFLLRDMSSVGWEVGILTAFSAILLSNVVTALAVTPYNIPVDWTPALVSGAILGTLAVVVFLVAVRAILREASRRRPG